MRLCDFVSNEGVPCGRKHTANGWCSAHYQQEVRGRELRPIQIRSNSPETKHSPAERTCDTKKLSPVESPETPAICNECPVSGCESRMTGWIRDDIPIPVCDKHRAMVHHIFGTDRENLVTNLLRAYSEGRRHTRGITYLVRLPNGNGKIGCVTRSDSEQLAHRLNELELAFGGEVELLATVGGGESKEAELHHLLRPHRLTSLLKEQFELAAVEQLASELGGVRARGREAVRRKAEIQRSHRWPQKLEGSGLTPLVRSVG